MHVDLSLLNTWRRSVKIDNERLDRVLFRDMCGNFVVGSFSEEFVGQGVYLAPQELDLMAERVIQSNLITTIEKQVPKSSHCFTYLSLTRIYTYATYMHL